MTYKFLDKINSPEALKNLSVKELEVLCSELRHFIIDVVSVYGGHFGASLGTVELTVALHHILNTPYDNIVWDTGHQAYGHKILTGRREIFTTNRIYKGLSGFPKRSESQYDTFGVGHSSTSISAALGMSIASFLAGQKDKRNVAVIGDGAMTAGLAFEGLNNAGITKSNILVVLNDNCMSIDPNVGALREYLTKITGDITTSKPYIKFKQEVGAVLDRLYALGHHAHDALRSLERSIKGVLLKESNLFEALNFKYFGPIDGHDVKHLVKSLKHIIDLPGPKLLHCLTVKGKGFDKAEKEQTKWHAPGLFDKTTGEIKKGDPNKKSPPKYQQVFGHTIVELAKENEKIVGVTPAMPSGSSLDIMMKEIPERAFDVGIAEQHAVTFSAGMATEGYIPFCNIYSSFMQRAYDQVVHDVAIQNLPVIFCLDRAGIAGADGPTHHGAYDLAFFRCIPNMIVSAPLNEEELRNLMYTAQAYLKHPFSIRYPRGKGVMVDWKKPLKLIEVGKGQKIRDGEEVAIVSIGHIGNEAIKATQRLSADYGVEVAHYDLRFVKPLDEEMLHEIFNEFDRIVAVEDACIKGGMGSAILEFMAEQGYQANVVRLGIPDKIIEHGEQPELWHECMYDAAAITKTVLSMINFQVSV